MEKPKIIAGGGVVRNDRQELLMIFRRGKWDLPKGKLDEGETIEACALREVMEETGLIALELGPLIQIGYHEYFDPYYKAQVIKETHWYAMHAPGEQQLVAQAEEDITEIKWAAGLELKKCLLDTYPNVAEVIHRAGIVTS